MARGDVRKDCRVADVPRLLEVGAEDRVDHGVRLALALREVDELMRGTRIGRALHALEGELDADRASLGGDARVELLGALRRAELRAPVLCAWHAACWQVGVELERQSTGARRSARRSAPRSEEHTSELQSHSDLV